MAEKQKHLGLEAILDRLPHRFPFLLVDRVVELVPGKSIVALKNVSANEAHFQGHFPGHAVMPGVLIVEALAQAGGVLAWETSKSEERGVTILYLFGIENARFKQPVWPGDQLELRAELKLNKRGFWRFDCRAAVAGRTVVEAEIIMAVGKDVD